jgi:transcriptional regulator with XRE-family HTH domain
MKNYLTFEEYCSTGEMKIGERIRAIRMEKGLSQRDIERQSAIPRTWQSRIECGYRDPSLGSLVKLAAAMEIPVERFFGAPPREATVCHLQQHEIDFLREMRALGTQLKWGQRKAVLALVKRMAAGERAVA